MKEIIRSKPHTLHPEVEKTLSALSNVLEAPYQIYNRAKLADMDFGTFSVDGREYPLSLYYLKGNGSMKMIQRLGVEQLKHFQIN